MKNVFPLLAAVGIGFLLGWFARPSDDGAPVEPSAGTAGGSGAATSGPRETVRLAAQSREAQLSSELANVRVEMAALRLERDGLKALVPAKDDVSAGDEDTDEAAVTFSYPSTKAALADVDWKVTGVALSKMPPLMAEMLQSVIDGEPKIALQGQIQTLNAPLVAQAIGLMGKEGLTGTGVNGLFTHPAVQVNFIASALFEAGLPLDERQAELLEDIGDRFLRDEQARMARYDEHTFALEKVIDETALRDRFFAEVDALLTSTQVEALHPAVGRGRLRADLYSSGLIWLTVTGQLRHSNRADLARKWGDTAMLKLGLPAESRDTVMQLAETFADGFSDAYLAQKPNALDMKKILRVDRVTIAAQQMLQFLKSLYEQVPMDEAKRNGIRDRAFVAVPINPDAE